MFPRVTHPSATPVLLRAFDLHVLSLPPAFVLSQDQTLMFKEFFPEITSSLDEVHSNHSLAGTTETVLIQETCLPDLALLGTQPTPWDQSRTECPKRRPRFSFFLFTCQRTERNQAPQYVTSRAHRTLICQTRQHDDLDRPKRPDMFLTSVLEDH